MSRNRSWPIVTETSTDRFRNALARFREEQAAKATPAPAKPKRKRTPKKVAA